MDARTHRRLTKGRLTPEGRIDLHGMTAAEAHPALQSYVLSAHAAGKRLILVITGKGRLRDDNAPMPVRQGVLRHQVPVWLSLPPLGRVVLQVLPAHPSHGGLGAYYVYLRRQRT
jgi:DNA-nicking Smr family endonuclease